MRMASTLDPQPRRVNIRTRKVVHRKSRQRKCVTHPSTNDVPTRSSAIGDVSTIVIFNKNKKTLFLVFAKRQQEHFFLCFF